jgi:hypothetical protein
MASGRGTQPDRFSPGNPGFLVSTALLLIDDIHHDAEFDYADYRWHTRPGVYHHLPDPWRGAILRGFRHIMEIQSPLSWDFGDTVGWVDLSRDARSDISETGLIPWFDLI